MTRRLIGNPEVLAEMLQDPQFRAEWERTALARAVAEAVIRYRAEHGLSQTGLARLLGWRQPVVARLEAAERNPSMDTLLTLARARPAGPCRRRPENRGHRQGHQVPGRRRIDFCSAATSGYVSQVPSSCQAGAVADGGNSAGAP